ncbi:MAG: 2OG-Fe(II) oxygenase family protein [Bacteroidota bacterium]
MKREDENIFNAGVFQLDIASFDPKLLKSCLQSFLARPMPYKAQFLQKHYAYGFDGYSFLGQEDSTNQYQTDLLHSFVLSDFRAPRDFPAEFWPFFAQSWSALQAQIRTLERDLIRRLGFPALADFYEANIGHMISCNYYPPTQDYNFTAEGNTRLSAHPDVSLFTIFPFGFDSDFYFQNTSGHWVNISPTDKIVLFPGYLLEYFSGGQIKALYHCVKLPEDRCAERFSFAFFSLPYPQLSFSIRGEQTTSEAYFKRYLGLF